MLLLPVVTGVFVNVVIHLIYPVAANMAVMLGGLPLVIESILRLALNWEQVNGIVINPFGKYIQMTKKMIELLINGYEYNENERKSKDDENN